MLCFYVINKLANLSFYYFQCIGVHFLIEQKLVSSSQNPNNNDPIEFRNLFILFSVAPCLAGPPVLQSGVPGVQASKQGPEAPAPAAGLSKLGKPTLAMSRWKKITGTALFINRLGKDIHIYSFNFILASSHFFSVLSSYNYYILYTLWISE